MSLSRKCQIQIIPVRIGFLYQFHFPFTIPFLNSLFACDRTLGCLVLLVPNELPYGILPGKPFDNFFLVLPDALQKIRCHTGVNCSITVACQNVYKKTFAHDCTNATGSPPSRGRRHLFTSLAFRGSRDHALCRFSHIVRRDDRQPGIGQQLSAELFVGAFHTYYQRHG